MRLIDLDHELTLRRRWLMLCFLANIVQVPLVWVSHPSGLWLALWSIAMLGVWRQQVHGDRFNRECERRNAELFRNIEAALDAHEVRRDARR